jgi:hypothetical protein
MNPILLGEFEYIKLGDMYVCYLGLTSTVKAYTKCGVRLDE